MPQLGWSTAKWKEFFEKIGIPASLWFKVKELRDQVRDAEIRVDEYDDVNDQLSAWKLSGVDYGSNTDDDGKIYVKLTDTSGTRKVELFSDSGQTSKVAEGSRSGDGSITLSEANSSGLSGSVTVTYSADDSNIYLKPRVGLFKQIQDMSEDDDADSELKRSFYTTFNRLISDLERNMSRIESLLDGAVMTWVGEKTKCHSTSVGGPDVTQTGGTVSVDFTDILGWLKDCMEDESSAQSLKKGSPSASAVTADADNSGKGTISNITLYDGARSARITFRCIDETIGSEYFEVTARYDEDGSQESAEYYAYVKSDFASPTLGIKTAKVTRTITDSGAESDHFSDWSISGETSSNTDAGKIYCKYTASTKLLELFSKDSRDADYLVANGTWDGVDGSTVTLAEQNASGMSGSVKVSQVSGADPADTSDLEVNLNVFSKEDVFFFDITEGTAKGQELFWRLWDMTLPSADSPTIPDGIFNRGF